MRNLLKNINLFIFKCLIVFCVLFNITGTHAQIYPVQISNQLIPPYSGYLPDYADPSSEKLRLILQFNDFTKPNYDVKLKLEIKGNGFSLVTKQLYNPPPISLQPGVPFILTGTDLAPYLNSNNLDFIGINQSQYEQRMALPEGYYSICVTAYDYSNPAKIQVSNTACSNAWFTLSNPPLLNLPGCNSILTPQTPQNILFQWTPVNIGSPNSANSTEYEFALWEIKPDSSANPNQVVLSTAPIYSTTTNLTIVNYGITEPPLNLYTKYAWRVRAVDLSGRDWFKNNGYSQVCAFTYGNVGNVLGNSLSLNLTAQGITHRMGFCNWNNQSAFNNYKLQVRKQGTTNWFDYNTTSNSEKINNLEPNTDYEARVRGESNSYTSDWSNTATFRTLSEPVYGCGDQSQLNDPLPANPLPVTKAIPGLIVQSGQFEVKVTQISPNGGQGWYKGKGIAKVMGLPVAVQFTNIYIDDNNRHQQGVIQAMTKGIDNWLHQWDIKDAEENASYFNGTIDSVHVNANGQICVYFQGTGRDSCFDAPNQNVVVVRDENGNQYTVQLIPPPPKVIGPTNYFQVSNDILEASDSLKVVFEPSPNQKFGFDAKKYTAWTNNYELIKLAGGKTYFVPYKSVGENQNDEVYANVTAFNFDAQKLSFKTVGGQTCTAVNVQGKLYKLTVPHTANAVYAWYNGKKIGKLSVISLPAITRKLVIVPVNNATINNQALNNQALNTIFQQANVSWSVSIKSSFNYSLSPNGLQAADAGLMSKYSPEMRALRDAYRNADTTYDKQAYYVFVVNNFSDPNIKGYMVRGRALGFVASTGLATEMVRTIAHELAHGAFGLEHTFPTIQKSSSDNLLDYKQGTELSKVQWEEMQSNKPIISWFDTEEDASFYENLANNESAFMSYNFAANNPYFDKAAKLFGDILAKSSAYAIQYDRSNSLYTTVKAKMFFFGNEISIENTFNAMTHFNKDIDFLMAWGLDFYDLQIDLNSNWQQKIYFYLARSEDKWQHSKQAPLAIDLLARVATGIPSAVYGYATGKDLIDGHTLSSAEHALNLLEVVPVTLIGNKVLKGIRSIKVGEKVLDLAASSFSKTKEEIKKLAGKAFTGGEELLNSFKSKSGINAIKIADNTLLNKVKSWQGSGNYPGIDDWEIFEIPEGTKLYGGLPGQSEFYSIEQSLIDVNYIKEGYWKRLQVSPHPQLGYRSKVGEYVTKAKIKVAVSKTLANPQHGVGGAWQIYVDDYNNNLNLLKEITLQ